MFSTKGRTIIFLEGGYENYGKKIFAGSEKNKLFANVIG